jgi:hypothetical protein
MENITGIRIYDCGVRKIIKVNTLARAASMARQRNEQIDIIKNGVIMGLKEAGSHRINWI